MLRDLIKTEAINVNLQSDDKDEVFEELTETLISLCPKLDRKEVLASFLEREKKMTTGIVTGIAIPHAISDKITEPLCAIGISRNGIDYDALDGKPVHIIFMILFPAGDAALHLNIMQRLACVFSDSTFYKSVIHKESASQVAQAIFDIDESI